MNLFISIVPFVGYVTYSDVCRFKREHFFISTVFDVDSCSPYMYAGSEWISYEDRKSIECKTNYVKTENFGGFMIFSPNTDDFTSYCQYGSADSRFPLTSIVNSLLFASENSNHS